MQRRWKKWFMIPIVIVGSIVAIMIWALVSFHVRNWADKRASGIPAPLSYKDISVVEKLFGVNFPSSTVFIQIYYNWKGGLYCRSQFDKSELKEFQNEHKWLPDNKAGNLIDMISSPPLRSTIGFFGADAKPISWWKVSKEKVIHVANSKTTGDPGGCIYILIQSHGPSQVEVYMVRLSSVPSLPTEIEEIFPKNKVGWDVRESNKYPKRIMK